MTCDKCQLWIDNCVCLKCLNCKRKNFFEIDSKIIHDTENYTYTKIKIYMCNECNNIFGENYVD
jgi:hypothetical protein